MCIFSFTWVLYKICLHNKVFFFGYNLARNVSPKEKLFYNALQSNIFNVAQLVTNCGYNIGCWALQVSWVLSDWLKLKTMLNWTNQSRFDKSTQWMRQHVYKTLGTRVIYSPISPLSVKIIFIRQNEIFLYFIMNYML